MLIEFRVKNFYSIQDEQILSLVSSSQKQHPNNTFQAENQNIQLLKSVAIYGPNAAGKSNVVNALRIMREIVLKSATTQRGKQLPLKPFLLGKNEKNEKDKPCEFEVSFISNATRYRYGFNATSERIVEEWLFAYPNGRAQQWFLRAYDETKDEYVYEFGAKFLGEKKLWETATRDNALFLSTAIQLNGKSLQPVFDWFLQINIKHATHNFNNALDITIQSFEDEPAIILDYLKAVDLDIENLKVEKRVISLEKLRKDLPNELKNKLKKSKEIVNIKTIHLNQDNEPITFGMNLESDGTKIFFEFLGPILVTLKEGKVLVVDELHNHLHPLMTRFIISLFHNETINKNNAQLIFTTHETSILDEEIFRKDQIYFCEKQNKATKIYSLSDFKGLRENIDYEKSYLLGRFGALPFIKSNLGINNGK